MFYTTTVIFIYLDPCSFIVVMLISAAFFSPFLLGTAYLICYVITIQSIPIATKSQSNELQQNELQLDTCVGYEDGTCYLSMSEWMIKAEVGIN